MEAIRRQSTRTLALLLLTAVLSAPASTRVRGQDCDATASISIGRAGAPSGRVTVELRGGSLCAVTGFTAAIGHDNRRVEFVRAHPGPFLESQSRQPFFFSQGRNSEGYMTLFVAFGLGTPPMTVPEDSVLATLIYRIKPGAPTGTVLLRTQNRTFGRPPTASIFTTRGSAIEPQLEDGVITITNCDTGSSLSIGDASASAGEVTVELRGSSFCKVNGFSLAVGHQDDRIEFVSAEPGQILVEHAGSDLVFVAEEHNSERFVSLRAAFDESEPVTVPPIAIPEDSVLATLVYRIRARATPGILRLRNADEAFGDPLIRNVFTTDDDSHLEPELTDGSVTILETVEPVAEFRRGDANADGNLGFSDAVAMIALRGPGGTDLPCVKAADANDDGTVNLADALFLLNFLFGFGPALPAPFIACGPDETDDGLSCRSFPVCP